MGSASRYQLLLTSNATHTIEFDDYISQAALSYVLSLTEQGCLAADGGFAEDLNVHTGKVTPSTVAANISYDYVVLRRCLAKRLRILTHIRPSARYGSGRARSRC